MQPAVFSARRPARTTRTRATLTHPWTSRWRLARLLERLVDEQLVSAIASRSVSSLIRTQGIGDLYHIFLTTQRDGLDFNLAAIPDDFDAPKQELFDPAYMTELFELGYQTAKNGYPWRKAPPGFEETESKELGSHTVSNPAPLMASSTFAG